MSGYTTEGGANGVHLVGSIPVSSNTETFKKILTTLPHRLRRLPDGETGKRYYFTRRQNAVFMRSPFIMHANHLLNTPFAGQDLSASTGAQVELGPTRYDDAALASYEEFLRLKEEGVIGSKIRFQVGISTPVNVVSRWVREEYQAEVEPAYEALLLKALSRIQNSIPARDLAIQSTAQLNLQC